MLQQRNMLSGGLMLTLRNWPALAWTYAFNVGLAWLFTLPLHKQIDAITAHSLASGRLTGAFDLATMTEVTMKLFKGPGPATQGSFFSTPIYLAVYFLLVPGTLVCYQAGAPARLFTLLKSGLDYFWRFVRITLIGLVVFAVVLGGLHALQNRWSEYVDEHMVGRESFLLRLAGLAVIGLVAALLRLYFDLVQVYTVYLGLQAHPVAAGSKKKPERQIRDTFKPAWKTYRRNFVRAYATFLSLALLGFAAVVLSARTAMHSLGQPHVWPMFLLAQLGLFLMLLTRFWQRGAETVLALDNPMPVSVAVEPEPPFHEEVFAEPSSPEPFPDEPAHIEIEEEKDGSSAEPLAYSI